MTTIKVAPGVFGAQMPEPFFSENGGIEKFVLVHTDGMHYLGFPNAHSVSHAECARHLMREHSADFVSAGHCYYHIDNGRVVVSKKLTFNSFTCTEAFGHSTTPLMTPEVESAMVECVSEYLNGFFARFFLPT